jgi:hypothetical protein
LPRPTNNLIMWQIIGEVEVIAANKKAHRSGPLLQANKVYFLAAGAAAAGAAAAAAAAC